MAILRIVIAFTLFTAMSSSDAALNYGLYKWGKDFKTLDETVFQINNMPAPGNQGRMGICFAVTAATLIDEANCRSNKTENCSAQPDDKRVSPLDLSRYSRDLPNSVDYTDRFNYEGVIEGGSPAMVLRNALGSGSMAKASCVPYEKIMLTEGKTVIESQQLSDAKIKDLKKVWETFNAAKTNDQESQHALAEKLVKDFQLTVSPQEAFDALSEKTLGGYLDRVLIPDACWDAKNQVGFKGRWKLEIFPELGHTTDYDALLQKIKSLITAGRPLAISFCAQDKLKAKSIKGCGDLSHSVVISGFKVVCNKDNVCHQMFKVLNSWGAQWQTENDDGWADAKMLLDRTFYGEQAITWLEEKT